VERICALLIAILLIIGCQTTKPAGTQAAGTAAQQQQAAQAQQQSQSSAAQEQQAAPGTAAARSVSRGGGGAAASPAKLVSAVSGQINNLFNKVKALVKKRPAAPPSRPRPAGPSVSLGERLKATLRGVNLASPDLLPTLAAAAILLGGGSLVLAAILTRRRRS